MNHSTETLLDVESQKFADKTSEFLTAVFDDVPPVIVERLGNRIVIRTCRGVPLKASGVKLAKLDISIRCRVDASNLYLAVEKSTIKLTALLDRAPIFAGSTNGMRIASQRRIFTCMHTEAHSPTSFRSAGTRIRTAWSRFTSLSAGRAFAPASRT